MAPSAVSTPSQNGNHENGTRAAYPKPLKLSGALEQFKFEEITPFLGREFINVDIVDDLMNADKADERLRDLAITSKCRLITDLGLIPPLTHRQPVSQRGVVFFRAQNTLTDSLQKTFIQRLGELSGKPSTSGLHIHPILNNTSEFGVVDDAQISVISSAARKEIYKHEITPSQTRYDTALWHSDIQFEPVPADYSSLRLTKLPSSGGDTLWASGCELYERFSPAYRKFFEGLTATFQGDKFVRAAEANPEKVRIHEGPRGSPLNVGKTLTAVHPVVRTNPVTGWKSLFAVGSQPSAINELNAEESAELLTRLRDMLERNHDLQVRFKWRNENDIGEDPYRLASLLSMRLSTDFRSYMG